MLAKELLTNIEYHLIQGDIDREIKGIAYDSRHVEPDFLFVAVQGLSVDGHDYIDEAISRGAIMVVGDRVACLQGQENVTFVCVDNSRHSLSRLSYDFYNQPTEHLSLIGVTGTNGKTSTTTLMKTIFRSAGKKTGLFGTIENTLDDEILPAVHTTPESKELQEMLNTLVEKKAEYAVMEVSSHALTLERVRDCDFKVGVFTNLTQDHLDFHLDMEDYFLAKLKLFQQMECFASKDDSKERYIVLNQDDPYSQRIMNETSLRVVTFGIHQQADYMARDIEVGLSGIHFTLDYPKGKMSLHLQMTGFFMVYNCLAAVVVAIEEGIETDIMIRALEETKVPGRFEPIQEGQNFAVVVDYAHTPDSLKNAIETAKDVAENKVITVFGCGGDRDKTKRPIMGKIGVELSDYAVITSDNPRTEEPDSIISDIIEGLDEAERYEVETDRRRAIQRSIMLAKPGDLVLIAGKGHEDYQICGTKKYPFSDILIAREAIKERLDHD